MLWTPEWKLLLFPSFPAIIMSKARVAFLSHSHLSEVARSLLSQLKPVLPQAACHTS